MWVNRFAKGMIAGGFVGALMGAAAMLRSSYQTQERIRARTRMAGDGARRAAQTVAHNAARLGTSTVAFAKRVTRNRIQPEV